MHHPLKTLAAAPFAGFALVGVAAAAPLTVTIDGVEDRGGTFYVSVQTEADYMKPTGTDGTVADAPGIGTVAYAYDVPPGDYAVTVWHDDDGNGQFDYGPDGMPADGWALSGMAANGPSFEAAKVTVDEDGASVTVSMTYGR